jgi:hypothetical protein
MKKRLVLFTCIVLGVFLFACCAPALTTSPFDVIKSAASAASEVPASTALTETADISETAPPETSVSAEPAVSASGEPSVSPEPSETVSPEPSPTVTPEPSPTVTTEPIPTVTPTPEPSPLVEQKTPKTGVLKNSKKGSRIAPFKVNVPKGERNFYIKLIDKKTNKVAYEFFVRGSSKKLSAKIATGTYLLRYACGTKWYGKKDCFGPETEYLSSDMDLKFYKKGRTIYYQILTLYSVKDGNMPTQNIAPEDF